MKKNTKNRYILIVDDSESERLIIRKAISEAFGFKNELKGKLRSGNLIEFSFQYDGDIIYLHEMLEISTSAILEKCENYNYDLVLLDLAWSSEDIEFYNKKVIDTEFDKMHLQVQDVITSVMKKEKDIRFPGGIQFLIWWKYAETRKYNKSPEIVIVSSYLTENLMRLLFSLGADGVYKREYFSERNREALKSSMELSLFKHDAQIMKLEGLKKKILQINEKHRRIQNEFKLIYTDENMIKAIETAIDVADNKSPVVIFGETGTGKESVAKILHRESIERRDKPFVPVVLSSLAENLVESELFGHKKGAFTGANADKKGYFSLADKGVLFLDEINSANKDVQTKLLRVLQEKKVLPLGGKEWENSDFRLVCATNENLEELMEKGIIRDDFFYRVNVIEITIPPLRERKNDIILLADFFVKKYWKEESKVGEAPIIDDVAKSVLESFHWPGNVRQLASVIAAIVAVKKNSSPITIEDIRMRHKKIVTTETGVIFENISNNSHLKLDEIIKLIIEKAVKTCDGNKAKAAKQLGISRGKLYKYLSHDGASYVYKK